MNDPKKRKFYKFIILDLDDISIIITRFGMKVKNMLKEARIKDMPTMYAFTTEPNETMVNNCKKVGIKLFTKPENIKDVFLQLRHMADDHNMMLDDKPAYLKTPERKR